PTPPAARLLPDGSPGRTAPSPVPTAPGVPGPGGGQAEPVPAVSCPEIRDEQSRLGYRCIVDTLQQDAPDNLLGLRISLNAEVEPDWVLSEGSGNPRSVSGPPSDTVVVGWRQSPQPAGPALPSAAQVRDEVRRRPSVALQRGYGDSPSSRTMLEHVRSFGGVAGYELVTEIIINPAYRAQQNLATRTERLWVVGLPTTAGVSIFMLSIPDRRADLWPKAAATVATVHVL
ncbi:MAG: hypothetical protein QOE23_3758, partial [Pseudonocardiales bacterium]|nr:hypothetical protein [Pseudonocardiales bacterium]